MVAPSGTRAWYRDPLQAVVLPLLLAMTGANVLAMLPWRWIDSPVASGWVQAVGSIAAILVAVGVAAYQNYTESKRRVRQDQAEARRMIQLLAHLTALAHLMAQDVQEFRGNPSNSETRENRDYWRHEFGKLQSSLEGIPIHLLPSVTTLQFLLNVRSWIGNALKLLAEPIGLEVSEATICGPKYQSPWKPVVAYLQDNVHYLEFEATRLDNPDARAPWQ
jgi:hypothetical protein